MYYFVGSRFFLRFGEYKRALFKFMDLLIGIDQQLPFKQPKCKGIFCYQVSDRFSNGASDCITSADKRVYIGGFSKAVS